MRFCHYDLLGLQWVHLSMKLDVPGLGLVQLGNFGHCCRKYVRGQGRGRIPVHGTNLYRKNTVLHKAHFPMEGFHLRGGRRKAVCVHRFGGWRAQYGQGGLWGGVFLDNGPFMNCF